MESSSAHPAKPTRYLFGPFRLRPDTGVLYRGDELVSLAPKTFDVLLLLVENAGEVVSKQQILDKVWADSFVEESSLTKNISILRKTLDEGFPGVEVIRTISKRGYQFTAAVVSEDHPAAAPAAPVAATLVEAAPEAPVRASAEAAQGTPGPSIRVVRPVLRMPLRIWLAVALLVVASAGVWSLRARLLPRPARSTVAVISFHDLSGKPSSAWLGGAVSEMLTTELDADDKLRTLPGDVTARIRADLALPDQNGFSDEILGRIHRAVDCVYVVSGSYLSIEGKVRLDIRVQDAEKPERTAALVFSGTETDLPELVAKAGAGIRARFGSGALTSAEEQRAGLALGALAPSDPEVRRVYFEALESLRAMDPSGAKRLLEVVVAKDPKFAMGHLHLSTALLQTGYELRAKEQSRLAFDLAGRLTTAERLLAEARYREMAGLWPRAAEVYASLWTFEPDNSEFGFGLARAQAQAGTGRLALQTLAKLRLGGSADTKARADLAEAEMLLAGGEYAKAALGFSAVIGQTRRLGARLLEGRAQAGQALASEKAGDFAKSRAALQEAIRLCSEVGDSGCVALALNNESVQLTDSGDAAGGIEAAERALQLARRTGNRGQEARALNIQGLGLRRAGDLGAARGAFVECLGIARDVGDSKLVLVALRRLGDVSTRIGDGPAARAYYTELMQLARQSDNKGELASALDSIGRMEQRQGDLPAARRDLEEALRLHREAGADAPVASSLTFLANLAKNMGDLVAADRLRAEECKLLQKLGRKEPLLRCKAAKAEIDLLQGRFHEAATTSQAVVDEAGTPATSSEAHRILALARLASGDLAGAAVAIRTARTVVSKSEDLSSSAPVTIAAGRIEAAAGHKREASLLFRQAMDQSKRAETLSLILETRLAMAEAASRDGDRSASKQLADLSAEAASRGYGGVAARAQKILDGAKLALSKSK